MKTLFFIFFISIPLFAADIKLSDYDWSLTDISSKDITKEALFRSMDRSFVKTKNSICSNRALMWSNDFKRKHLLDTGKIFLFYTKKKSEYSLKTWWYHVSPVVNENENLWVLDAGFPGWIKAPLTPKDWLYKFSNSTNCKEIKASEKDLVKLIFKSITFPQNTSYGSYDCYYKIVPHTIWTPNILAMNLLGENEDGDPIRLEREEIDLGELYQACIEATSSKIGWALGSSKKLCQEYVDRSI